VFLEDSTAGLACPTMSLLLDEKTFFFKRVIANLGLKQKKALNLRLANGEALQ
jgi:hypothetical protein